MEQMKFKFTIQNYQTEAVNSVVKVFAGQPFQDKVSYRRDAGNHMAGNLFAYDDEFYMGFSNAPIALNQNQLLKNIQDIQNNNNIKESSALAKHMGACSLDVEMETGTGKTYVYIKTMFELNKRYGWSKFIVVVPSIAIREGVQKSFQTMQDHFMEQYGKKARFFVYTSKNLTDIDSFSSSADLSVMIINVQAFNAEFNKEKNKEGRGGDKAARIIFSARDDFGSRKPIDVIAANRPIVILDEPQKMGGKKTQEALKEFHPLFTLNYSATHKEHHDLVYVLDALDAYRMKLVKKIEVKGFDIHNLRGTDGYLYLENIIISPKKPPMARLEFEIKYDKSIKRETRIVGVDDDLYALSKEMEQYQGYHINDIDPIRGVVTFTNGTEIHTGEVLGDVSEKDIRRVQIRETIRSHFEKEKELYNRGIKTLSLFFIDKVENYRKYDEEGNEVNSEYGQMFEEEYISILNEYLTLFNTPYDQYLKRIDVHATHAGYFSIDKKGHKVDSKTKRGSDLSDDESAYELILKDKERLLSLDNPVRFIFSHSALREGWDNPNVFQICTLKHGGDSTTNKRQEVGRGLRLCVNQSGDRMDEQVLGSDVQEINKLTVIASDGYKDFVSSLQNDIKDDLYERPTKATVEYFQGKRIKIGDDMVTITSDQANAIYFYLVKNSYIDEDGHVTDAYRADAENKTLVPLPNKLKSMAVGVHALVQAIFDEHALDDMIDDGHQTKIQENALNDNFYKKEFQTLWHYINHKWSYTVHFDSQELIQKAIRHIDEKLFVSQLQYTVTKGQQGDWSAETIKSGNLAKKNVQDYVFTDGTAEKSIERKFAEDMDLDDKVVVYAKLPRGFQIPTPVGNYAPDWAIAFQKGTVKHIYFVAETKGSMESMDLRPIEQAKIKCAKTLFNEISTDDVVYGQVDSYQNLLSMMNAI